MGQFLSPPSPITYKTKCAVILYPADDGDFFLNALRGQLSELGRSYVWEGDRAKQFEIAQIWREHDLLTDEVFFRLNCEDVPLITGDENMNINVNVNCNSNCCNGSSSGNLVCYDAAGNPIITPGPYNPDPLNPSGGDWPMNPGTDIPPSDFEDWTEYDTNACGASNAIYELLILIFTAAYGVVDLGAKLAWVLVTFAGLFPAAVASALGSAFLLRAVEALLAFETRADDIKDWLTEAIAYLHDNQQEFVCFLFQHRHDIPALKTNLSSKIVTWVADFFTLSLGDTAILANIIDKLLPVNVFLDWYTKAAAWVALTVNPIDCQTCIPDLDYYATIGTDTPEWDSQWGASLRASISNDYGYLAPKLGAAGDADIVSDHAMWSSTIKTITCKLGQDNLGLGTKSLDVVLFTDTDEEIARVTIIASGQGPSLPETATIAGAQQFIIPVYSTAIPDRIVFDGIHNNDTNNGSFRLFDVGVQYS